MPTYMCSNKYVPFSHQVIPYWLAQFFGAFFSSAVVYGVYIGMKFVIF